MRRIDTSLSAVAPALGRRYSGCCTAQIYKKNSQDPHGYYASSYSFNSNLRWQGTGVRP